MGLSDSSYTTYFRSHSHPHLFRNCDCRTTNRAIKQQVDLASQPPSLFSLQLLLPLVCLASLLNLLRIRYLAVARLGQTLPLSLALTQVEALGPLVKTQLVKTLLLVPARARAFLARLVQTSSSSRALVLVRSASLNNLLQVRAPAFLAVEARLAKILTRQNQVAPLARSLIVGLILASL